MTLLSPWPRPPTALRNTPNQCSNAVSMQDYQASGRVYTKNEDRGTRALRIDVKFRMLSPQLGSRS
jgi:hypothetical protein